MYKTIFTIDGIAPAYIGYTSGRLWNGWATPYFEVNEAFAVMKDFNKNYEGTEPRGTNSSSTMKDLKISNVGREQITTPTRELNTSTELVHTVGYGMQ